MANRRMVCRDVTGSARFLRMPVSSRELYFQLLMDADDDGAVEAFTTMRKIGASEDDLQVLAAKKFVVILDAENLITWIMEWFEHNVIRADRLIESRYRDLILRLVPALKLSESTREDANNRRKKRREVGTYSSAAAAPPHGAVTPPPSIEEYSIGKDNSSISNDILQVDVQSPSTVGGKKKETREGVLGVMEEPTKSLWLYWEELNAEITTSLAENRSAINKLLEVSKGDEEQVKKLMRLAMKAWEVKYAPKEAKASSPKTLWEKRGTLLAWAKGQFIRDQEDHQANQPIPV